MSSEICRKYEYFVTFLYFVQKYALYLLNMQIISGAKNAEKRRN